MNFNISLDKNYEGHTPKKFRCPSCEKKRYVRFFDYEKNDYLPYEFGRCDREEHCGYYQSPDKAFFKEKYQQEEQYNNEQSKKATPSTAKTFVSNLPKTYLARSLQDSNNIFLKCIENIFGSNTSNAVKEQFKIGTSTYWKGANIFWQIDINGNIRSGKVMLYGNDFKRVKAPYNHVHWVHSLLKKHNQLPKNFELQQCFFGEHQLNGNNTSNDRNFDGNDKSNNRNKYSNNHGNTSNKATIAIVESAKTAILGWLWKPEYIWLSSEGSNGLNMEKCKVLKDRKVILFPDFNSNCREKWLEVGQQIQLTHHTDISMGQIGMDYENGNDLADLILNTPDIIHEIQYRFEDLQIFKRANLIGVVIPFIQKGKTYSVSDLIMLIADIFQEDHNSRLVLLALEAVVSDRMELAKIDEKGIEFYQIR